MSAPSLEFELESLHEFEGESELEGEFESEFEFEFEGEGQFEFEGELEHEQFFGRLAQLAKRGLQSPALRRIGMTAARSALGGLGSLLSEHELEGEGEFESEHEFEFETNPIRRVYPDAMMEHFAHVAAEAESEQEAGEAFLPLIGLAAAKLLPMAAKAIAPMAAKALPKIASSVMRAAPNLTRAISNVGRTLYRNPSTRPLLRTLPTIANRTIGNIARQAARGQAVTPQAAVRTLAQQAARVLGSPQQSVRAYQRGRALDRNFHKRIASGAVTQGSRANRRCACMNRGR